MKSIISIFIVCLLVVANVSAQDSTAVKQAAYTTVITQRANKIVAQLGIIDSTKFYKVQNIIVAQYRHLNKVHDSANAKIKALKVANTDKEIVVAGTAKIEADRMTLLNSFHQQYFTQLSKELSPEQVVKVKDGMTYNKVTVTYNGYTAMIPSLTADQKTKINDLLLEAREYAVDAESSEKKTEWFGKYKGKINNYLSAQGYDMKKEGLAWEERNKAAKLANQKQQ
jgi:Protein of unknown function (DUF3826)